MNDALGSFMSSVVVERGPESV